MKTNVIFAVLFIALLSGCSTAYIESNKVAGHDKKLTKVFIYINCANRKSAEEFGYELGSLIKENLLSYKVASRVSVRDPLALEKENKVNERIEHYSPAEIMEITQTYIIVGNNPIMGTWKITLKDANSKKAFWTGEIDVSYLYGGLGAGGAIKCVKKLFLQLNTDGLL